MKTVHRNAKPMPGASCRSTGGPPQGVGNPAFGAGSPPPVVVELRGEKGSLREGGTRVPFVVRRPGVVPVGTACDVPAKGATSRRNFRTAPAPCMRG